MTLQQVNSNKSPRDAGRADQETQVMNCARAAIKNYLMDHITEAASYVGSVERVCGKKTSHLVSRNVFLEKHGGISVFEAAVLAHDKAAFTHGALVGHLRYIPPNNPSMGAHDQLLALGHYAVQLDFIEGAAAVAGAAAARAGATGVIFHSKSPFFAAALQHSPAMAAATFGAMGGTIGGKVYTETRTYHVTKAPRDHHQAALRAIAGIQMPASEPPTNFIDLLDSPPADAPQAA